ASRYVSTALGVQRVRLSSLGACIGSDGKWDIPGTLTSLEEWRQRGTLGRDHFAKIVRKGYLMPFGHRASLVKITERKFDFSDSGGTLKAYLRQRIFIVVRVPVKTFGTFNATTKQGAFASIHNEGQWRLRTVEIK